MRIRRYAEREAIINEGEIGDCFYIIHVGKVTIFKKQKLENSDKIVMNRLTDLHSGDSFGELALMQATPR